MPSPTTIVRPNQRPRYVTRLRQSPRTRHFTSCIRKTISFEYHIFLLQAQDLDQDPDQDSDLDLDPDQDQDQDQDKNQDSDPDQDPDLDQDLDLDQDQHCISENLLALRIIFNSFLVMLSSPQHYITLYATIH